jgi:hypothetical protein
MSSWNELVSKKRGFDLMSAQNELVSEKMGKNGFWFDVLTE